MLMSGRSTAHAATGAILVQLLPSRERLTPTHASPRWTVGTRATRASGIVGCVSTRKLYRLSCLRSLAPRPSMVMARKPSQCTRSVDRHVCTKRWPSCTGLRRTYRWYAPRSRARLTRPSNSQAVLPSALWRSFEGSRRASTHPGCRPSMRWRSVHCDGLDTVPRFAGEPCGCTRMGGRFSGAK